MNLEEPCPGLEQKDVAMATKGKLSMIICFVNMEEVMGNHIVNAIAFDKLKATSDGDHLEKPVDGRKNDSGRVEK
jgi:hypothetical protein